MNTRLLIYSLLVLLTFGSVGSYTWMVIKKKISTTSMLYTAVGVALLTLVIITTQNFTELNYRLSANLQAPKELYSENVQTQDSTITDKLLFEYLQSTRVPHARIILMQARLESSNYKSTLFQRNRNLFGMKIPSNRTSTTNSGRAGYAEYKSWKESVNDYTLWQFSRNLDKISDEEYLEFLGQVYAEDPNYVLKLKKQLFKYDFNLFVSR